MGGTTSYYTTSHTHNHNDSHNDSHNDNRVDNSNHVSETRQRTVTPSITIANATCGKVRLYYKAKKMALSDLIEGSQLKKGDSILIREGTFKKTPLPQSLYVTGFQVESNKTHNCPEESPLNGLNNLLAQYAKGHPKSYILTVDKEVKLAKKGEIWVDVDGVDYTPKKKRHKGTSCILSVFKIK